MCVRLPSFVLATVRDVLVWVLVCVCLQSALELATCCCFHCLVAHLRLTFG